MVFEGRINTTIAIARLHSTTNITSHLKNVTLSAAKGLHRLK